MAAVARNVFILLVAALCCLHTVYCLDLTATPNSFIPGVTPSVTFRCVPGQTMSLLTNIAVIQIAKDNVLLVTAKPTGPELNDQRSKFGCESHIDPTDLGNSSLVFTVKFPEVTDAGEYVCFMTYFDNTGLSQRIEARLLMTQNVSATNNASLQQQLDNALQQVQNLQSRVHLLEDSVFGLGKDAQNQTQRITELSMIVTNHFAFFATLKERLRIQQDDTVIFDLPVFNRGGGYNETTGVFKAPRAGFYVLSVVCEVKITEIFRMEMMTQVDGVTAMKLYISADIQAQGGQQSGSLIYQLNKGSEVKVVVGIIQATPGIPVELASENLSYFSGYFLGGS